MIKHVLKCEIQCMWTKLVCWIWFFVTRLVKYHSDARLSLLRKENIRDGSFHKVGSHFHYSNFSSGKADPYKNPFPVSTYTHTHTHTHIYPVKTVGATLTALKHTTLHDVCLTSRSFFLQISPDKLKIFPNSSMQKKKKTKSEQM